jgi:hypothetical protein
MNSKFLKAICLFLLSSGYLISQEFKLAKNTGSVNINISSAIVEAYDGKEIIISYGKIEDRRNTESEQPRQIPGVATGTTVDINNGAISYRNSSEPCVDCRDRRDNKTQGLRVLSASGLPDNTGFGINIKDNGSTVDIVKIGRKDSRFINVKVPKSMNIKVTNDELGGNKIYLKNVEAEIEASVLYNSIILDNVTGPMTIKTTYGSVDGELNQSVKSPISIISTYGSVDLKVAKTIKANLHLSAPYGDVFAAPEMDIVIEPTASNNKSWTNEAIKGKINGGGIDLSVKCSYGKIYLRN